MSVKDIREDMTPYVMRTDGASREIVASFETQGYFNVTYTTRFGEQWSVKGLSKIEASKAVSNLRKRGYQASYAPETFI